MTNAVERKALFIPLPDTGSTALPKQAAQQLLEADRLQKRIADAHSMHPKPGPVKKQKFKKGVNLVADTEDQLTQMLGATNKAVGSKKRGNKRIGKTALYGDLIQYFTLLKQHGVTLPRGGSLSLAACNHGLGDILRSHRYLAPDQTDRALKNSKIREELGHKLARVFDRVAEAVESTPA